MTAMAQAADEAVVAPMAKLEDAVAAVRQCETVPERKLPHKEAQKAFSQAKSAVGALRNEVKRIEDPTQKSVYARKYAEAEGRLKGYAAEMKDLMRVKKAAAPSQHQKDMEGIMGEGNATGQKFESKTQVMDAAVRATDGNTRLMERIEMNVNTVEATGNEVATVVAGQTERIREIDKEMDTLQAEIDRAKGDVMWFARQMAGDKCFLIIMVLVIAALVLLTGFSIFEKRTGTEPATAPPPESIGRRRVQPQTAIVPPPQPSHRSRSH